MTIINASHPTHTGGRLWQSFRLSKHVGTYVYRYITSRPTGNRNRWYRKMTIRDASPYDVAILFVFYVNNDVITVKHV